jgi:hypothetical protein
LELWLALRNQRVTLHLHSGCDQPNPRLSSSRPARTRTTSTSFPVRGLPQNVQKGGRRRALSVCPMPNCQKGRVLFLSACTARFQHEFVQQSPRVFCCLSEPFIRSHRLFSSEVALTRHRHDVLIWSAPFTFTLVSNVPGLPPPALQGGGVRRVPGRGLHSSTSQLNLSRV